MVIILVVWLLKRKKTVNKQKDLKASRIGIDLLGCDAPANVILETIAAMPQEEEHPPQFTVFGTQDVLKDIPDGIESCIVTEEITMEEDPLVAVRRKKNSSIVRAMHMLASYDLDAFISAGNTGALMASASLCLPMLPGIDRPALMALMPTKIDPVAVLDVGANVNFKAENLLQFALMGIAYQKARGVANPTVGLLNIGAEKQKGTPEVRKAYEMLQKLNKDAPVLHPIFVGNIEGRDVFHGNIHVLITDGFTGNVFLKTSEGIAGFILDHLQNLGPIESLPGLKSIIQVLRHRLDYAEYPGAILCGVDGIVIKCHGESNPQAFTHSIKSADRLNKHFFLEKLKIELLK